jgi:tRNA pseudouridine38/39 synthase
MSVVQANLFAAMAKTRLLQQHKTWQELKYSRAGRTDKGVSALGQVVALMLRSAAKVDDPSLPEDEELDYPALLNRVLPADIRILGWTTVPEDFSARCGQLIIPFFSKYLHRKHLHTSKERKRTGLKA